VLACVDEWHASGRRGDGFNGMIESLLAPVDWDVVDVERIKGALINILTGAPANELAAVSDVATSERKMLQDPGTTLARLERTNPEAYEALAGLISIADKRSSLASQGGV
jgi:hypothetical protein